MSTAASPDHPQPVPVSLAAAMRVWARIGWLGFGGPAGQIALMHRELVERRRWISEARFLHALNYCMLLPGPEAQQLAVYIGWLMHRTRGGVAAGVLFVIPGVIVLGALSALYVSLGHVPVVGAIFFGLKAAVLAVVVEALLRVARRGLKSRFAVALAAASFIAIFAFAIPFPLLILAAGAIGWKVSRIAPGLLPAPAVSAAAADIDCVVDRLLASGEATHTRPSWRRLAITLASWSLAWLLPLALATAWLGPDHTIVREGRFFAQSAVVTFGGAYAVLAYVAQHVVGELGWLRPGEMIDGLALAETTPGPLIMVLQHVGFVAAHRFPGALAPWPAAALGALMTTWVTFVPSFVFIFAGAPYVESLRRHAGLHAAMSAITAAVVGVILNLSVWFALHTIFARSAPWQAGPLNLELPVLASLQPAALVLAVLALVATLRFKLGLGWVLGGCAVLGLAWSLVHPALQAR